MVEDHARVFWNEIVDRATDELREAHKEVKRRAESFLDTHDRLIRDIELDGNGVERQARLVSLEHHAPSDEIVERLFPRAVFLPRHCASLVAFSSRSSCAKYLELRYGAEGATKSHMKTIPPNNPSAAPAPPHTHVLTEPHLPRDPRDANESRVPGATPNPNQGNKEDQGREGQGRDNASKETKESMAKEGIQPGTPAAGYYAAGHAPHRGKKSQDKRLTDEGLNPPERQRMSTPVPRHEAIKFHKEGRRPRMIQLQAEKSAAASGYIP